MVNWLNPNFNNNSNDRVIVPSRFAQLMIFLLLSGCALGLWAGETVADEQPGFYYRGAFYQDWMLLKYEGSDIYQRLGSRLRLTFWNQPGAGWTAEIDVRDRYTISHSSSNQLIIYDAHVSYDHLDKKLFFSLGQMNLYDTAGIGQLTGAVAGYKFAKFFSAGVYAGLEPDIYEADFDFKHNKYGAFFRYTGPGAKQFAVSFNRLTYDGQTERQFVYSNLLFPYKRLFVLYGNLEYELDSITKPEDRLSHLFFNARVNVTQYADITANLSSGRGLDYHRFLLEQSQNPTVQNQEIERYYYNETYGVRLTLKPLKWVRLYGARRESEAKDRGIRNHTTRFGFSLSDLLHTGIFLYGNYNINRGDASESDAFYVSVSRNFGRLNWSLSVANFYNGVRFTGDGEPEVFYLPDRLTLSTNVFFIFNRSFALSLDYAYSYQEDNYQHQFFIRAIYRPRSR